MVEARLSPHHLRVIPELRTSKTVQPGVLLGQLPLPHVRVRDGSIFYAVVSAGPPPVAVPTVVGESRAQATATLHHAGFKSTFPASLAAYSPSIPAGEALAVFAGNAQNPQTAAFGTTLDVQLSKGPPPVPVPSVLGLPGLVAVARLQRAGFAPVVEHAFSTTVPAGNVISTTPGATTPLQPGQDVALLVSEGAPVTVPVLGHLTLAQAERAIVDAGLTVLSVHGSTGAKEWTSEPTAGTQVPKGTAITLYAG